LLTLTWPGAHTLDRVVLFDRPNLDDQVTGGTLTFSDGSTVAVPSLDNAGAATTVDFPARATTSLRFAVTSVSGATHNVGLSEIQAWTDAAAVTGSAVASPEVGPLTGKSFIRAAVRPKIQPGADPPEARSSVGRAPRVELPKASDVPSVLGTAMVWNVAGATVRVQPTAAETVDAGSSPTRRLVRVTVNITSESGLVNYTAKDLTLRTSNGRLYTSAATAPAGDVAQLSAGTLSVGQSVSGAIYFQIPANAPPFVLAYTPATKRSVLGTWILSAP
jgi:hypothetical protein